MKESPILGLVLAGGKSSRMGFDKGTIHYHKKPHRIHLCDLLHAQSIPPFISLAEDESLPYPVIQDIHPAKGPIGGILSAFEKYPDHAWLTIACDLPYVDAAAIKELIEKRDPSKIATCFQRVDSEYLDPLFTIWEPASLPLLKEALNNQKKCPRKVLLNGNTKVIPQSRVEVLTNVNDATLLAKVKSQLR